MKKWIEFQLGAEKQIKISQAGRSGSLFYEGYRQGLAGVIEIVRASTYYTQLCDCFSCRNGLEDGSHGAWCGLPGGQRESARAARRGQQEERCAMRGCVEYYGAAEDKDFYNYPNNMIVFTGGRGTGKSSAMLTFVDSLSRRNSLIFQRDFLSEVVKCELPGTVSESDTDAAVDLVHELMRRCAFLQLSPIDPTTLEKDGQILVNILARMFQKAEEVWEQNKHTHRNDLNEKNELMRQFTTCYEYACAIKQQGTKRSEFDGLDVLSSLGDSSSLKRQMALLVEKLLHFAVPEFGKDSFLVLQIDDTDMNIQQAYSILEDIRKYLVIPRLIIVMAADLEHLSRVVKDSLLRSYTGQDSSQTSPHVHAIASQYISKLIPQSRRICLPELGVYLKEHPDTEIRYNVGKTPILPNSSQFPDSQEQIFRLIYQKTGMIFLRQENRLHYIIPDNMRLLAYFLAMLVQMKEAADIEAKDPEFFLPSGRSREEHLARLQTRLQNVQRFRDYFLGTWASNALTEEHAQYLRELSATNLPNKIRIVCSELGSSESYTYADMSRLLREKDRTATTDEEKRYCFAIHTYFSMLAHSIVLEELVDHYEDGGEEYCVFKRLYPVFGSRIFPYATGQKVMFKPREKQEGLEPELFQILWKAPEKMDMPEVLSHNPLNPGHLYSMLCPYALSDGETDIWADFTTPIVNCLYLSPNNYASPLSERAVDRFANTGGMKKDTWGNMQSAALLVLLNWDIQQVLGSQILGSIVPSASQSGGEKGDIVANLDTFYNFLVKPFQKDSQSDDSEDTDADKSMQQTLAANTQAKSEETDQAKKPLADSGRFAISCLSSINLAVWLKPLKEEQKKLEQCKDKQQEGQKQEEQEQEEQQEEEQQQEEQEEEQQEEEQQLQAWESVVNRFYPVHKEKTDTLGDKTGIPAEEKNDVPADEKIDVSAGETAAEPSAEGSREPDQNS